MLQASCPPQSIAGALLSAGIEEDAARQYARVRGRAGSPRAPARSSPKRQRTPPAPPQALRADGFTDTQRLLLAEGEDLLAVGFRRAHARLLLASLARARSGTYFLQRALRAPAHAPASAASRQR